jgi:hypothetical protein
VAPAQEDTGAGAVAVGKEGTGKDPGTSLQIVKVTGTLQKSTFSH